MIEYMQLLQQKQNNLQNQTLSQGFNLEPDDHKEQKLNQVYQKNQNENDQMAQHNPLKKRLVFLKQINSQNTNSKLNSNYLTQRNNQTQLEQSQMFDNKEYLSQRVGNQIPQKPLTSKLDQSYQSLSQPKIIPPLFQKLLEKLSRKTNDKKLNLTALKENQNTYLQKFGTLFLQRQTHSQFQDFQSKSPNSIFLPEMKVIQQQCQSSQRRVINSENQIRIRTRNTMVNRTVDESYISGITRERINQSQENNRDFKIGQFRAQSNINPQRNKNKNDNQVQNEQNQAINPSIEEINMIRQKEAQYSVQTQRIPLLNTNQIQFQTPERKLQQIQALSSSLEGIKKQSINFQQITLKEIILNLNKSQNHKLQQSQIQQQPKLQIVNIEQSSQFDKPQIIKQGLIPSQTQKFQSNNFKRQLSLRKKRNSYTRNSQQQFQQSGRDSQIKSQNKQSRLSTEQNLISSIDTLNLRSKASSRIVQDANQAILEAQKKNNFDFHISSIDGFAVQQSATPINLNSKIRGQAKVSKRFKRGIDKLNSQQNKITSRAFDMQNIKQQLNITVMSDEDIEDDAHTPIDVLRFMKHNYN